MKHDQFKFGVILDGHEVLIRPEVSRSKDRFLMEGEAYISMRRLMWDYDFLSVETWRSCSSNTMSL